MGNVNWIYVDIICLLLDRKEIRTIVVVSPFALVNPFMEFHMSFYEELLFLFTRNRKISWISEISIFLAFRYLLLDFWVFFGDRTLVTSGPDFILLLFGPLLKHTISFQFLCPIFNRHPIPILRVILILCFLQPLSLVNEYESRCTRGQCSELIIILLL